MYVVIARAGCWPDETISAGLLFGLWDEGRSHSSQAVEENLIDVDSEHECSDRYIDCFALVPHMHAGLPILQEMVDGHSEKLVYPD